MKRQTLSTSKTPAGFTASVYACALSAASVSETPARVQLLPAGLFRAADGRPGNLGMGYADWRMDGAAFAACRDKAQSRSNDYVFDYEHQSLLTAQNGQPNPAAGWFKELELDDTGLWALDVRWTARAKAAIAAGEYRYVSAVFACDDTGAVVRLHSAALTNTPALDGMAAVALTRLTTLSTNFDFDSDNNPNPNFEDAPMKSLLVALNLQDTATEAQAIVALTTLQSQLSTAKAVAFDPAKHIALTEHAALQGELQALKGKIETTERDALMALCLGDGRIAPAQQAYWAAQPLTALSAYAQVATPNPAMGKDSQAKGAPGAGAAANKGKPAGADYHALSEEMQKVVDDTGMSPEQFNAAGGMKVATGDDA